ncbi:MAG: hypothetical protein ACJ75H_15110 [Thermoanaerobaculia bacterium]
MSYLKKITPLVLAATLALPSLARAEAPADTQGFIASAAAQAFSNVERRVLTADIAEYSFRVRTGPGKYDEIGVHRVVKEIAPNVPVRASRAVVMLHGDVWGFDGAFLSGVASPAVPDDRNLPVFLAQNGVDVWGIDLGWTLVPGTETDFSFMNGWGIERDARDLGIGIGVARFTRAMTGSGFGKVTLLAWSRGGQIAYAYLNGETQIPAGLRQVSGFIPVDIYLKTDVAALKQAACDRLDAFVAQGSSPVSGNGGLFQALGTLAELAPDADSPIPLFPDGITNRQAALIVGAATFQIFAPVPFYHFTGGAFDANSLPSGLLYTNETAFYDFDKGASPFEPSKVVNDGDEATCERNDVAFDDHLADINVPVLYVGAGGGFGEFGLYTVSLLGSTDVSNHIVNTASPRVVDFGHADLFLGNDAQSLVWQPILSWVQGH